MAKQQAGVPGAAAPRKRSRKAWMIVGALVVVIALAGVGGWKWHEQPSFCATLCHSPMQSYYEGYVDSGYLVRAHAESGITCLGCHEPTIAQQVNELKVKISGNYEEPLTTRVYENSFCGGADCHGEATLLAISEKYTSDLEFDPHDNHVTLAAKCLSCHKMHREQKPLTCVGCHDEGQLDFEWTAAASK